MVVIPTFDDVQEVAGTFHIHSGSGNNENNSYLDIENSNVRSYVMPYPVTLTGLSLSTNIAETWTAEVRRNGVATVLASLAVVAARTGTRNDLSVDFDVDDEIEFYCNGSGVGSPLITATFMRRARP
jgi:hypothetical protein